MTTTYHEQPERIIISPDAERAALAARLDAIEAKLRELESMFHGMRRGSRASFDDIAQRLEKLGV